MSSSNQTPIPLPDGSSPGRTLDILHVAGDGYEAGARYGEAAKTLIHRHLAGVVDRNRRRKNLTLAETHRRAAAYRAVVAEEFPDIAGEIDGIAEGADIELESAWLLQLRAEVSRVDPSQLPAECTSFGATAPATATGTTIAGQNGDLPAFYGDVLVLVQRSRDQAPSYLTLTPAGQVAWHGINDAGVAIFANFLYSHGWRLGIPRYLFTRIAMDHVTARGAADHLMRIRRGSSRNVLIADETTVLDVELAVDRAGVVEADDGLVTHANHHISDIAELERATDDYIRNSRARHDRMTQLLHEARTKIDLAYAATALRDRTDLPDAISRAPGDQPGKDDTVTIASTVADVAARTMWIALGPPHLAAYHPYDLAQQQVTTQ